MLRERFWSGLSQYLSSAHPELPMVEAKETHWVRLPSEVTHIGFELKFVPQKRSVRIEVWFWRDASRPIWEEIRHAPSDFKNLLQAELVFDGLPDTGRAVISAISAPTNLLDESTWPDVYRWIGPRLAALYRDGVPLLRRRLEALAGPGAEARK